MAKVWRIYYPYIKLKELLKHVPEGGRAGGGEGGRGMEIILGKVFEMMQRTHVKCEK